MIQQIKKFLNNHYYKFLIFLEMDKINLLEKQRKTFIISNSCYVKHVKLHSNNIANLKKKLL